MSEVADDEILYRAVAPDPRLLSIGEDRVPRISSNAFNDPARRPSVDRAALCSGGIDESLARFRPGSGILSLNAGEVRTLSATHGGTGQIYLVDVEPVPLPENVAHAEIFGRPPFDTDKVFDRIKQRLARLAVVALPPKF